MRPVFILGTAAELIKVYPVILEAQARGLGWSALSTGQSPVGLSAQWEDFALPADRLRVGVASAEDLAASGAALRWFGRAWWARPELDGDVALVHGDTLSTLAGARWAKRAGLPLAHVEAGLRSRRLLSPFPEEINRRLVSRAADWHFAPDDWSEANLRRAGYARGVVNTHGNTLADAVQTILAAGEAKADRPYAVVNVHRFENLNSGARWGFIRETLARAAEKIELRLVMHAPTAAKIAAAPAWRAELEAKGARFLPRQPFTRFIRELAAAEFVISDGGSNQEECHYLGQPCLLLRRESERREGLDGGSCLLSEFDPGKVGGFLEHPRAFKRPPAFPARRPSRVILDTLVSP